MKLSIYLVVLTCLFQGIDLSADESLEIEQSLSTSYVTYRFNPGRFGDRLLTYMRAKWISYKYDIPILYKPFKYSDQMLFDFEEINFDTFDRSYFKDSTLLKDVCIYEDNVEEFSSQERHLFESPYCPERCFGEYSDPSLPCYKEVPFYVNWDDKGFKKELQKIISPIFPVNFPIEIPLSRISVAIHLRVSPNREEAFHNEWPVKSPPVSFYINQLNHVSDLLGNLPLFVHIFTTSKLSIKHKMTFEEHFKESDMIFSVREAVVNDNLNVLDDFFTMARFDCIIHGDSNFSNCAAIIGDPMIEVKALPNHNENSGMLIGAVRTRIAMWDGMILYIDRDPETGEITRERTVYIE